MEVIVAIAAVALVTIQAHRNYLMMQSSKQINVTVPVPEVHVTIEAPEPIELQAIETVEYDYTYLEAILQQLVELQKNQQLPYVIPTPIPMPQYPNYPPITYGETRTGNEIEVDGVKGKQFPAK